MTRTLRTTWAVLLAVPSLVAVGEELTIEPVRIGAIEEVVVPARREGPLVALGVREGTPVEAGAEIGRVDDAAARLAARRAKLQLDLAREQAKGTAAVDLARASLAEARSAVDRAELRVRAAERTAENELAIRAAEAAVAKARADVAKWSVEVDIAARQSKSTVDEEIAGKTTDTAQMELDRAVATRSRVGDAVSLSEINALTLERDKARLEVDRAREDRAIAALVEKLKLAERDASQSVASAAEVGVKSATFEHGMASLAVDLERDGVTAARLAVETARAKVAKAVEDAQLVALQVSVAETEHEIAEEELARYAVVAPVTGVVVERHRGRGEWVKPGDDVVRILRLDRLRAEAFVEIGELDTSAVGSPAIVEVTTRRGPRRIRGEVTYVGLEVDLLKKQVLVRIEFDNPNLEVLPGQLGRAVVER